MKKLLILLLAVVLLCGCAGTQEEEPPADDSTSPPETAMQSDTVPSPETTAGPASDDLLCRGRVVIAEDDVITRPDIERPADLSGIEIRVYYGKRTSRDTYGFNYDHSVFTDKDGTFIFTKPSEFYSVQIDFSSLPKGYGAASPTVISNVSEKDNKEKILPISAISKVEAEYNGGGVGVIPRMFDSWGNAVVAEYTVTRNSVDAIDFKYEEVYSLDEFILTGTITASQVDFEYTAHADISKMNVMGKINVLYQYDVINEGKKIELYCYVVLDGRVQLYHAYPTLQTIEDYIKAHEGEDFSPALKEAIDSVYNLLPEQRKH